MHRLPCYLCSYKHLTTDFLRYERDEQWKEDEILAAKIKKFLAVRTIACLTPGVNARVASLCDLRSVGFE